MKFDPSLIVFEDHEFLAINKTPGWVVQGAQSEAESLLSAIRKFFKERNPDSHELLFPLHRLDRNVSGIVVFAKTKNSAKKFSEAIQRGGLKKTYLAITWGTCSKSGKFEDYLLKSHFKSFVRDSSNPEAKKSTLTYECLETYPKTQTLPLGASLVKISLQTGRYHQIRVQFSSRGFPLFGDKKYAPKKVKDLFQRPALHAFELEMEGFIFKAPLPEDLKNLTNALKKGTFSPK